MRTTKRPVLKILSKSQTDRYSKKLSWEQYGKISELFGEIDFGCNFEQGHCNPRHYPLEHISKDQASHPCCCVGCANKWVEPGYLRIIPKGKTNEIFSYWNSKTGFWRKDKGCILPRKYRSPICVTYLCAGICNSLRKSQPWKSLTRLTSGYCNHQDKPITNSQLNRILQNARNNLVKLGYIKQQEEE